MSSTEIKTVVLELTGALAGFNGMLNGRRFANGRTSVTEASNVIQGAVSYFGSCYQAHPVGSPEHTAAVNRDRAHREKGKNNGQRDLPPGAVGNPNQAVHGGVQPARSGAGPQAPAVVGGNAPAAPGTAQGVAGGNGHPSPAAPVGDPVNAPKS